MNEKIPALVIAAYADIADDAAPGSITEATPLYGTEGGLNSIKLVMLIADVEQKVAETLGKNIVLADEKALSRKASPFLTVKTLVSYIEQLVAEEGK